MRSVRAGAAVRSVRQQPSKRSKLITKFVNSHPEGVTVKDVVSEFCDMGINGAKAKVYLVRASARKDIIRVEADLYGPAAFNMKGQQ